MEEGDRVILLTDDESLVCLVHQVEDVLTEEEQPVRYITLELRVVGNVRL